MFQLNEEDTEGVDDAEDYAIDHKGADHHQPGLANQIIRSKTNLENSSCQSNFRSTLPLQLKRFIYKILFKP